MTYITIIQDDYNLYINSNNFNIGKITFYINKLNFDNYKRIYPRLQSLLVNVMSVISLLFEIGRQIINILFNKHEYRYCRKFVGKKKNLFFKE